MIEKIHFSTLDEAIEYAKDNGGWIFSDDNRTIGIWYNPAVYGMSQILRDAPGTGRIDRRGWFLSERNAKEGGGSHEVNDKGN
jgi:hypothetical protein